MSQSYNWYQETDAPEGVPIIDLGDLRRKMDNPTTRQNAVKSFLQKCQKWGVFYIKNHGMDQAVLDELTRESKREIEGLSAEERAKYHYTNHQTHEVEKRGYVGGEDNQQKEVFDDDGLLTVDYITKWEWGDVQNVAPTAAFAHRFENYYDHVTGIASFLAGTACTGLGVAQRTTKAFSEGGTILKLENFPDMPQEQDATKLRFCEHTDIDVVTVLYQTPCDSGAVSLQAMVDGDWVGLPAIEGTMIVNFGEVMQSVAADRVKAAYLRVVGPSTQNLEGTARVSVVGFYRPPYDFEFQVPKDTKFKHIYTPGETLTYKECLHRCFEKYYTEKAPPQQHS